MVPGRDKHLASEDDERWDCPACCADALDYSNPLAIAWLDPLWSAALFRACKDHLSFDLAHHKPGLVEVVGVFILDAILLLDRLNKGEPRAYNAWVFV